MSKRLNVELFEKGGRPELAASENGEGKKQAPQKNWEKNKP